MRRLVFFTLMFLFVLVSCDFDKKEKEDKKEKAKEVKQEPQPIRFSIRNETNELEEILRIAPNGELYHRGKKITNDDRIIAALYDMVLSSDATLNKCLDKLSLYRRDQVSGLMKRVVEAENKALKSQPAKAEAEAEKSNVKKEK